MAGEEIHSRSLRIEAMEVNISVGWLKVPKSMEGGWKGSVVVISIAPREKGRIMARGIVLPPSQAISATAASGEA